MPKMLSLRDACQADPALKESVAGVEVALYKNFQELQQTLDDVYNVGFRRGMDYAMDVVRSVLRVKDQAEEPLRTVENIGSMPTNVVDK